MNRMNFMFFLMLTLAFACKKKEEKEFPRYNNYNSDCNSSWNLPKVIFTKISSSDTLFEGMEDTLYFKVTITNQVFKKGFIRLDIDSDLNGKDYDNNVFINKDFRFTIQFNGDDSVKIIPIKPKDNKIYEQNRDVKIKVNTITYSLFDKDSNDRYCSFNLKEDSLFLKYYFKNNDSLPYIGFDNTFSNIFIAQESNSFPFNIPIKLNSEFAGVETKVYYAIEGSADSTRDFKFLSPNPLIIPPGKKENLRFQIIDDSEYEKENIKIRLLYAINGIVRKSEKEKLTDEIEIVILNEEDK